MFWFRVSVIARAPPFWSIVALSFVLNFCFGLAAPALVWSQYVEVSFPDHAPEIIGTPSDWARAAGAANTNSAATVQASDRRMAVTMVPPTYPRARKVARRP